MTTFINQFQYCGQDTFNNHLFVKRDNVPKLEMYLKNQAVLKNYKMPYFTNTNNDRFYKLKLQNNLKVYKLVKGKHYKITYKARKWHFKENEQSGFCLDVIKIKAVILHHSDPGKLDTSKKPLQIVDPQIVDPDDVDFLFVDN
jgi:hypothetical protein